MINVDDLFYYSYYGFNFKFNNWGDLHPFKIEQLNILSLQLHVFIKIEVLSKTININPFVLYILFNRKK